MENEVLNEKESRLSIRLFITAICAGVLSIALGLIVLVGWYTDSKSLIQIIPAFVPMQYNTALGFVLCGSGMLLAIFKKRHSAVIIGVSVIVLGSLTLLEYLMGLNLGFDEFFMKHSITVKTSHPGRMAPNTATCFTLIGSILVFPILIRNRIYQSQLNAILASITFGLGIVALSGYIIQLEPAYGWGSLTRMAVHTSIGFIVLSVGVLALTWCNDFNIETIVPRWLPVPIAIVVLTATFCFWQALQSEYVVIAKQSVVKTGFSHLSTALLIVGSLLAFALALAVYLAQTSIRRAREVVTANFILADEITERKRTEEALRESDAQVRLLLESTAEAIYGLDLEGKCTFCNPSCLHLLGYEHTSQLLGKNMHDLIHHTRPDGSKYPMKECRIYEAFQRGEGTHVSEEVLWRADGSSFPAEYWSYPIRRAGEIIGAVVTFLDITERIHAEEELREHRDHLEELVEKRTGELKVTNKQLEQEVTDRRKIEDTLKSSLKLIQLIGYSSVDEIMHFALEEGVRLSGSKIGYFHFVNPDQETIRLQAWSRETLKHCSVGEKDSHYPIERAGVWVDCIHQKEAVIHNEYESLSHKKGLPEGHVPLVRDMAVPVIENEKIVAVLGVGNKEQDYTQFDIDQLSLLAENTWSIIQRKRAEEEVQRVNKELRETVKELKKANQKILRQQKAVIEEERLKVLLQMAGATAHELNQPLTVLLGNIELIGVTENVPKELATTLSMIQKSGRSIASIIKKIQNVRQYDTKQYCEDHFIINLDQKINVLSVEDSDDDFGTISTISKDIDQITLSRAKSMEQAVKMLQQNQFDLVFLDYLLPDGNGIDLLSIMNQKGIEAPAIVITGQGDEMVASQAIREGAYDYLKKSKVTVESLQKSIVSTLEKFRLKKEVRRAQEKMAEMSTRDGLTALYNHRYFMEVLEREVARSRRYKTSLALYMLDIDHFKQVNDTYGHPAGDMVLSELGSMLNEYTRKSDLACRYGGEEFAVILPNAHSEEARIVCERFRERVAMHVFNYDASQFNISVSIGLASFDHTTPDTPFDLIVKTDKSLYRAKSEGRNRVKIYAKDPLEIAGKQIINQ